MSETPQKQWGPWPATVLPSKRWNDRDGDTFKALVDQGCDNLTRKGIRINGINARELSEPGGPEARAYLRDLVPEGMVVTVISVTWDKYANRLDCDVDVPGIGDLASRLIADGYAAAWDGTGPRPVPPWPIP